MPIYEYACSQCGKLNDVLQKLNDPAPEACVACNEKGTLTKVVSRSSFVLKGGGWYSDLYSSTKKDSGESSSGGSASSASSATPASAAPASSESGGSSSSTTTSTTATPTKVAS